MLFPTTQKVNNIACLCMSAFNPKLFFVDLADFGAGLFSLIFESGDTIQCQPVPIRTDDIIEGNETFSIFIVDASPMVTVNMDSQDIVIIDSTGAYIPL